MKVTRQISRSHWPQIDNFDLNWTFIDCNSTFNLRMNAKWCTKIEVAQKRCLIVFQGYPSNFTSKEIDDLDPNWAFPDNNSSFNASMVTKLCTKFKRDKKSLILTRIKRFRAENPVSIHRWLRNSAQSLKMPYYFSRSSIKFQGHTDRKMAVFSSDLSVSGWELYYQCTDDYQMTHVILRIWKRLSIIIRGHL